MGPSGAGKSTLLDILSKRTPHSTGTASYLRLNFKLSLTLSLVQITVNGTVNANMSALASYVEQSDALLGVLTVQETLYFSARLRPVPSIPATAPILDPSTPTRIIHERVAQTIADLGLSDVTRNRIGTPVQRGISGGQKRRVTLGAALVTLPRILLLDEPTSGLDSRTSREVLTAIRDFARRHGVIVVASIHQPNWETFTLFDKLLLLAHGRTVYYGPIGRLDAYLAEGLSHSVSQHANPSDHALDVVNTDFMVDSAEAIRHVEGLARCWSEYAAKHHAGHRLTFLEPKHGSLAVGAASRSETWRGLTVGMRRTWCLMERNALNYSRNLLAYGVRIGMYLGMGVLLATVWVNLPQTSAKVNDRLSVHFFSVAFLGFMSVAGIPAFLEERQVFVRERMNGLYGPGPYVLANSLVTLPYLFLCAHRLNPGASQFFRFLGVLFLAVYTAESQSAVVAAIVPIFVAALAIASFLNGFWMCVGGYFIKAVNLPRFWYYWAHFIDFQTYAFDLLVQNDLRGLTFACATLADGSCFCDYPSSLVAQGRCALAGEDVLRALDIDGVSFSLYAAILLLISLVYRALLYAVLVLKKR
ncbi:P-loop containing nucleoside triphosphate hydrolase protein [Amylostereum chailletii]|nr:P-loop containing nucleoside triphosphate hydrolase protein [Amylostereum chailletii]